MKRLAFTLLLCLAACSDQSDPSQKAGKTYRDPYGRTFRVMPGNVVDPPMAGAALRVAIRAVQGAARDVATCTDQSVVKRRESLTKELSVQFDRLRAIGLEDEIMAAKADLAFESQSELRVGCSRDASTNRRVLDLLEHWIAILSKWGT